MEVPKDSSSEQLFRERLQRLLSLQPTTSRPFVTRFQSWDICFFDDDENPDLYNFLALGVGNPELCEFDVQAREAAIRWLATAESAWLEDMRRAMPTLAGGVQYPELAPPEEIVAASLGRLLSEAGDLGMSAEIVVGGQPRKGIDVFLFAHRLQSLRTTVLLAVGFQNVEQPAALFKATERAMELLEPGITAQVHALFGDRNEAHFALARMFMVAGMDWLLKGRLLEPQSLAGPLPVAPGPVSPLLEIWLVAALSIGAIVPPYPLPGLYQCSYHLCGKVFTSLKRGVSGQRRFCCPEHGRRFYASRRMKEKSKKAKRAAQPEGE